SSATLGAGDSSSATSASSRSDLWLQTVTSRAILTDLGAVTGRRGVGMSEQAGQVSGAAPADLAAVAELLRGWGRHWAAVGSLQRRLPLAVQRRLAALPNDPDTALAQT